MGLILILFCVFEKINIKNTPPFLGEWLISKKQNKKRLNFNKKYEISC